MLGNVLLIEGRGIVRAGLMLLLERMNVSIAGTAATGAEAVAGARRLAGLRAAEADQVRAIEHGPPPIRTPDLVVCSAWLPDRPGVDVMRDVLAVSFPGTRLLAILDGSGPDGGVTAEMIRAVFAAGASGLVTLSRSLVELHQAVESVLRGETYVDPATADTMRTFIQADESLPQSLTARQREVLVLLARGLKRRQIARTLGMNVKTVDAHRAGITQRTGIADIPGLTLYAAKHGLIAGGMQGRG